MTGDLLVVSDLHCGSTVGLHPDTPTELDDGGSYAPSKAQGWLWSKWLDFVAYTRSSLKRRPVWLVFNGDLVDGHHHGTVQVASNHTGVQGAILRRVVAPLLEAVNVAGVIVVRGTAAHVGQGSPTEEAFARWVKEQGHRVLADEDTGTLSWRHFRGELAGVTVDITHHGRTGGRPWTELGGVGNLATEIMAEYANRRELPPQLIIRSHRHRTFDTGENFRGTRLLATAAWQLGTDWVKQVRPDSLASIGGHLIHVADGRVVRVETRQYYPDTATRWRTM